MSNYEKRQGYVEDVMQSLIGNLPSSYNKEVGDTNFYKLLRAVTQELADAEIAIDEVRDNIYLDSVTGESIYNNFGVFVKLQKRAEWSEDKYRALIKGVMQALLKGPNKQNLLQAFQMFTQFDVKVFELYKDKEFVDPEIYKGYNPKYTFLLQIEKPLDANVDAGTLIDDANYIVNIIKPAHTIGIHIINLRGEEDFKQYYGVEKKIADLAKQIQTGKVEEKTDEWISQHINQLIADYAANNNVELSIATDEIYMQNHGMNKQDYEANALARAETLYDNYIKSFQTNPYDLNENDCIIPVLQLDYFKKIATAELRGTLDTQFLNGLKDTHYEESLSGLTITQLNIIINNRKNELINSYIANAHDPNDYTDAEWNQKAVQSLKNDAILNAIINALGGKVNLFNECKAEAEEYRDEFEQKYTDHPNYCGMDKIYVETNNLNRENSYGWKSLTYLGQFYTSTSFDKSKIGGTDLIGPRYTLYDNSNEAFEQASVERIRLQLSPFILNKSETLNAVLVLPDEDSLGIVALGYSEEKFNTSLDEIGTADLELSESYDNNLDTQLDVEFETKEDILIKDTMTETTSQQLEHNDVYDTESKTADSDTNVLDKVSTEQFVSPVDNLISIRVSNEELIEYSKTQTLFQLNSTSQTNLRVDQLGLTQKDLYSSEFEVAENVDIKAIIIEADDFNANEIQENVDIKTRTTDSFVFNEVMFEETISFASRIVGFSLNNPTDTINTATNTLSITTMDSGLGVLFRIDGEGNETIIEQRAI
ncbi:MAG: hypothetical protein K0R18_110 [Bacillales bacterium]|jgi:hypothetical protein|nr:hypothetical protein [Bacillales bacterium]